MSILGSVFKLGYEISPIILANGVASNVPGNMLPIVSLTEAANFTLGLLSGGTSLSLDNFFAHFKPIPGSSLIEQEVATYPFANQTVAANATISMPLKISMLMVCPAKGLAGTTAKSATITMLQNVLAQHNLSGGTYIVATPSYMYTNCLMTGMRDVSGGESKQAQYMYQLDFVQPLLSLDQAQQAQSSYMQKMTNMTEFQPNADGVLSFSGQSASIGNPASGLMPSVVPASSNLQGSLLGNVGTNAFLGNG